MPTVRHSLWLCVSLMLGCEPVELIMNPMVDRWCGERPCAWDVQGEIKRVGTWHSSDFAVELRSDEATLSQVNEAVNAHDTECYAFSMIADVGKAARVFLELDFLNDGSVEFSQRLPAGSWQRRTFMVRTPSWYEGVRFIVRKGGPGRVVLAELRAKPSENCTGERVALTERPSGAECEQDDECQTGRCAHGSCSFCRDHSECASDQICGVVRAAGQLVERCTRRGQAKFAEPCSWDEECAAGVCCGGLCSQCCPDTRACPDGVVCERSVGQTTSLAGRVFLPFQCGPGMRREPSGADCTANLDCQSSVCAGSLIGCDQLGCDEEAEADGGVDNPNCESLCPRLALRPGTCN